MALYKKFLKLGVIVLLIISFITCDKHDSVTIQKAEPLIFKSATELTAAIRSGEITSVNLLNRYLESIERNNDEINAVVALDVEAARARAVEADKALARGESWGPLHGLPVTVKDMLEVAGMPTTSGDPKLKDFIPKRNAIAVQRLVDAGAIIFGKTNVPYLGGDYQSYNKIYGTTNNPWDLSRTPGGSSGGSAAALAAGFTGLELGSDLGGSIRIPASYTGVFGHKPTFGIVPRYGHIPPMPGRVPPHLMPSAPLFVVGPLARSADDLELSLEVLTKSGKAEESGNKNALLPPRHKRFKDYRVAVWFTDPSPAAEIDAELLKKLNNTIGKLRTAGLKIDENARPDIHLWENVHLLGEIRDRLRSRRIPLYSELAEEQKKQEAKWAEFFKRYDVVLAPVSITAAFPHDHRKPISSRRLEVNGRQRPYTHNLTWAALAIVSGLPATVAPVGLSDSGLPVGIQIIGARLEDRTTIGFARGLSELTGGFVAPPGYGGYQ